MADYSDRNCEAYVLDLVKTEFDLREYSSELERYLDGLKEITNVTREVLDLRITV